LSDLTPGLWRQISDERDLAGEPAALAKSETLSAGESRFDVRSYFQNLLAENSWNLPKSLEYCERLLLECVLSSAHGNQSQVARLIGMTPRSVYNKLHKHKLNT
jgi:DNA-binding protein Fis